MNEDIKEVDEELAEEQRFEAQMRAKLAGTRSDQATMLDDGMIIVSTVIHHPDRRESTSNRDVPIDDPDYKRICVEFAINKPGDRGSKQYRWVDGAWVEGG